MQLLSSLPIGAIVSFCGDKWMVAAQNHPGYPENSTTLIMWQGMCCYRFDNHESTRWSISDIRKYLNASGTNWWQKRNSFHSAPWYASEEGFLTRFNDNWRDVIKPTSNRTIVIEAPYDEIVYDDTEDYAFLMSAKEVGFTEIAGSYRNGDLIEWNVPVSDEGTAFPLFSDAESRVIPDYDIDAGWSSTYALRSAFDAETLAYPGAGWWLLGVSCEFGFLNGTGPGFPDAIRPVINVSNQVKAMQIGDEWELVYPNRPVIESITTPRSAKAGEEFTISWTASDQDDDIAYYEVRNASNQLIYQGPDLHTVTELRDGYSGEGYKVQAVDATGLKSETVYSDYVFKINETIFYNSDLAGPDDIAIGKTTAELKNPNTYVGWDFDDVWAMEPGQYPYLKNVAYPTHGTLVDENNQPLVGAIISCGEARAITGLDGKFTIMLTVGQQKLLIEHPEYPPEEPIIDVPPPGPEGVPGHIVIPITIPFIPGQGAIRGLWRYADHKIFVHGNKIYKLIEGEEPEAIYSGISDVDCDGFAFGGKLYIVNGHEFLCYDGEAVYEPEPYVPTVRINAPPAGGGEEYEQFNLLTGKFKQTFIPDGNSNQFHLLFGDLDDVEVMGEHLDKELKEGVHFTVNKLTGVINTNGGSDPLGVPADSGGLATLSFVASKTNPEDRVKVIKNNRANIYGANNSIIHLYGNPDYPNRVIRSEAADPTYWPENTYTDFGASSSKVTGKVNQYGVSLVLKEREIYQEQYALRDDGTHAFRVETLNAKTGCVAPGTVAIAGDNAIFLSERGVHQVVSTNVENERNAPVISEKVNRDLLRRNLETAKAIVHGDHYLLHFPDDGFAWVYNYTTGSWVAWDSFRANCFLVDGNYLYFGGLDDGLVHRFKQSTDGSPYNDNGQPIRAEFHTKAFDFKYPSVYKMLRSISIGLRPGGDVSADVDYRTDKDAEWLPLFNASQTYSGVFMFSRLVFSRWKFGANPLPKTIRRRMNAKKLTSVQLRIKNDALNESMGLLFVELEYALQRRVR